MKLVGHPGVSDPAPNKIHGFLIKRGQISKEGMTVKSWKTRTLEFRTRNMVYLESKNTIKSFIDVVNIDKVEVIQYKDRPYVLKMETKAIQEGDHFTKKTDRTYYFDVGSPEAAQSWLEAINSFIVPLPPNSRIAEKVKNRNQKSFKNF